METTTQTQIREALEAMGYEVLVGKGGYWLRGHGHVSTAQARKLTGLKAEPRQFNLVIGSEWMIVANLGRRSR